MAVLKIVDLAEYISIILKPLARSAELVMMVRPISPLLLPGRNNLFFWNTSHWHH
jgi:hypothetical protein